MTSRRHALVLPDLDLPGATPTATAWLADLGARVVEGDRLVEILAGDATLDVSAPASGTLVKRCVAIDQPLAVGQTLAWIEVSE